ncbi:MAG: hypothetical protein HC841_01705 [Verrucomicrobiae bacterium]|nr:hypothetical protein [Verrucomicrobiae bacterium]
MAALLRRSGVVKITPKPFVELAVPNLEKAMKRGVEKGVIPSGATQLGNYRYRVQTPGTRMIERQISPEVCWAACSKTVLAAQGCDISQEKLVEVFRGNLGLLSRMEKPTEDFAGLEEICEFSNVWDGSQTAGRQSWRLRLRSRCMVLHRTCPRDVRSLSAWEEAMRWDMPMCSPA